MHHTFSTSLYVFDERVGEAVQNLWPDKTAAAKSGLYVHASLVPGANLRDLLKSKYVL